MREEITKVPEKQFWAYFAGIDKPVKVGPEILQRLIDTHGDINVMSFDQRGGWKKASEFGLYSSKVATQGESIKTNAKEVPVLSQHSQTRVMSTDQSLMYVSKLEDFDQVKLRMANGREVNMPVVLAKINVRLKGALVIRDSWVRVKDVGPNLR